MRICYTISFDHNSGSTCASSNLLRWHGVRLESHNLIHGTQLGPLPLQVASLLLTAQLARGSQLRAILKHDERDNRQK